MTCAWSGSRAIRPTTSRRFVVVERACRYSVTFRFLGCIFEPFALMYFFAIHHNFLGGADAEPYLLAAKAEDFDSNICADEYRFVGAAGKNQHRVSSLENPFKFENSGVGSSPAGAWRHDQLSLYVQPAGGGGTRHIATPVGH
jgi:hypothetical protein